MSPIWQEGMSDYAFQNNVTSTSLLFMTNIPGLWKVEIWT